MRQQGPRKEAPQRQAHPRPARNRCVGRVSSAPLLPPQGLRSGLTTTTTCSVVVCACGGSLRTRGSMASFATTRPRPRSTSSFTKMVSSATTSCTTRAGDGSSSISRSTAESGRRFHSRRLGSGRRQWKRMRQRRMRRGRPRLQLLSRRRKACACTSQAVRRWRRRWWMSSSIRRPRRRCPEQRRWELSRRTLFGGEAKAWCRPALRRRRRWRRTVRARQGAQWLCASRSRTRQTRSRSRSQSGWRRRRRWRWRWRWKSMTVPPFRSTSRWALRLRRQTCCLR